VTDREIDRDTQRRRWSRARTAGSSRLRDTGPRCRDWG